MHLILTLPGLHGLLITTFGIIHYRRSKRSKKCLIVELICGCLLIVAWLLILANIWLGWQTVLSSFFGGLLAASTTFVLSIAAIVRTIKAFISKRNRVQNIVGTLLNFLALIIYLIFALWMGNLVLLMLVGAEYM